MGLLIQNGDTIGGISSELVDKIGKVVQTPSNSSDEFYELLFSKTADNTERIEETRKSSGLLYNPSKKALTVGYRLAGSTVGTNSIALGGNVTASNTYSHAEGYGTIASNTYSHAEGYAALSSGSVSHAEGRGTTSSGEYSHTEGWGSTSSGIGSHAEGHNTIANHAYQHVFGDYNVADTSTAAATERGNYIEIVGNGSTARSNARTLDWNGNEMLAGNLSLAGASSDISLTGTNNTWDGTNTSLKDALDGKVSKSGDTMTGELKLYDTNIRTIDTNFSTDVNPSSDVWGRGYYLYCSDARVGYFRAIKDTGGAQGIQIETDRNILGTRYYHNLMLRIDNNGNKIVEVAAPDAWCTGINAVNKSGDTMTGQLKTSFKQAVATGSRQATASTVPDLCEELKMSSGCMGSVSIGTAYTKDGVTISTGWYNYLWIPHRSGGVNGESSGDNTAYGSLLLMGMTVNGFYKIRYASNAITRLDTYPIINKSSSYPTLQPAVGTNDWIQIGTANTDYGILPSQGGSRGSGHNNIGTSSWYWKAAYIDNVYCNNLAKVARQTWGTSVTFTPDNWSTPFLIVVNSTALVICTNGNLSGTHNLNGRSLNKDIYKSSSGTGTLSISWSTGETGLSSTVSVSMTNQGVYTVTLGSTGQIAVFYY